jgi:hypothetical protein
MTRSIMLAYQLPEFGYIIEQLEAMRNVYNTENNAMTILRMIEEKTGTKAPA